MYFESIYENGRMKPVEIIQGGRRGRTMEAINLTMIYCKHMCKYHNGSPAQLSYANKMIFKDFLLNSYSAS
jgi:hypothetical protein